MTYFSQLQFEKQSVQGYARAEQDPENRRYTDDRIIKEAGKQVADNRQAVRNGHTSHSYSLRNKDKYKYGGIYEREGPL